MNVLVEAFRAVTPLEWAAIAVTLLYVLLQLPATIWSFVPGVLSAILYGIFFWQAGLPANAILQFAYYLPMMAIGFWWWWTRGEEKTPDSLVIGKLSGKGWGILVGGSVAGTLGVMAVLPLIQPGSKTPFLDAATTVLSIGAQILVTRKLVENWILWIVVNALYVVMMAITQFWASFVLFSLFFVISVVGYVRWLRAERRAAVHA